MADLGTNNDSSVRLQVNDVDIKQSSARQTPITSFGQVFQNGVASGARAVGNTAAAAGYAIPGASVVGAAISGVGTVRDASTDGSMMTSSNSALLGSGSVGSTSGSLAGGSTGSAGGYMDNVAARAAGGDASSQMMMATQQMQEMNQTFNLQYLQLQEKTQAENREYSALSNVMKTKSDTAKNSLSNLK